MTDVIVVGAGVIGLLSALRLRQAGLSVEVYDKSEPATESSWAALGVLSPEAAAVRAPLHFRQGWRVDNVRLNSALVAALDKASVPVHSGRAITQIVSEGGRVLGVRAGADVYRAPWVVVAAGAWSGTIDGVSLPVR